MLDDDDNVVPNSFGSFCINLCDCYMDSCMLIWWQQQRYMHARFERIFQTAKEILFRLGAVQNWDAERQSLEHKINNKDRFLQTVEELLAWTYLQAGRQRGLKLWLHTQSLTVLDTMSTMNLLNAHVKSYISNEITMNCVRDLSCTIVLLKGFSNNRHHSCRQFAEHTMRPRVNTSGVSDSGKRAYPGVRIHRLNAMRTSKLHNA